MFLNFETGRGLVPDDPSQTSTSAPVNASSSPTDRTPAYVLETHTPSDVLSAVAFARENRLRLRIKSTGHDYLGRSSDEGSFTLWTRRLNHSRFERNFVPEGAPEGTQGVPALLAGAGSIVRDLYRAADEAGVIVTGGVSQTVGAGGGFTLGGGHGPLAPLHGLAADNVLEFTVVTANGTILRCSPYQHSTLFTALRGGGSAFAVVLETAFKVHAPPAGFVGIFGSFGLRQGADASPEERKEAWRGMVKRWTELQPKLSKAGPFAGYTYVRKPEPTPFAYILPSDDLQLAKDLFTPVFDASAADPNIEVDWEFVETKTWYELWSGPFTDALHSLDAVGIPLLLGSRLVPKEVVEQRTDDLANFLADSPSPAIVHLVAGGAVEKEPDFPSSVNPGWRTALLHIDLPISWPTSAPSATISSLSSYLTSHTLTLGALTSSLGHPQASYSSESDYYEADWQKVWYDEENYERLLRAKREWDPEGVFSARRAVGSEVVGW
ncbi:FAD linked oxidase [Rhodotorula toruloides]|uniref:FAD linked oxidase n=1 Tax=Rhodotorula toruloides TaxID=5286 RepID=A0A511KEW3_RHOTO|nr:FAD linked oxidase [Rhodotorula toruloides]